MRNRLFRGTDRLRTPEPSEVQLVDVAGNVLRAHLPAAWDLRVFDNRFLDRGHDAFISVMSPDGTRANIELEVKQRFDARDATILSLRRGIGDRSGRPLMIATSFLTPHTQNLLARADINYLDATGNFLLRLEAPPVFIKDTGAAINPWRVPRPLQSLKGSAAGRVIRALCDFRPPYGIRALADRAGTSPATTSRVITLLDREALLTRDTWGAITEVQWPDLLRRWTEDYKLTTSNTVTTYLDPRGLEALSGKLQNVTWQYAVTGSLAAVSFAPIAASRLATIYVETHERAANDLALRRAERGANVLLVEPFDRVVFERTNQRDGINYAALSQTAADLLTSPGRGPEEGEALLAWMEENQDAWRR